MDVWILFFTAFLLLVAIATCAVVIPDIRRGARRGSAPGPDRQQSLKARRRMERRRGRPQIVIE